MELEFWKYEGAGNDFVLIDGRDNGLNPSKEVIAYLCDRHRGIGADGLLLLMDTPEYDFRMRYFNADGGEVAMCGNGARCITLFAHHLGIGGKVKRFLGLDGSHEASVLSAENEEGIIEIGMIEVDSYEFGDRSFFLNTGVPHYVEFVDNVDAVDVVGRGREIRFDSRYEATGGTNVNFVQIIGPGELRVRTYERGVEDETLACGTGVTACAIATHLYAQNQCCDFTAFVPGGRLSVRFSTSDGQHFQNIRLSGPARRIFQGTITTNYLLAE